MLKRITITLLSLLILASVISCSSDNKDKDDKAASKISTSDFDIYLSENVDMYNEIEGDYDGIVAYAGKDAVENYSKKSDTATLSDRDLTALIAQIPAPGYSEYITDYDASDALETVISSITTTLYSVEISEENYDYYSSAFNVYTTTNVGVQTFAQDNSVLASYMASLGSEITPTGFINGLIQQIGINKEDGSISNLLEPEEEEPASTDYRLYVGVKYYSEATETYPDGSIVLLLVVVPEELVDAYSSLASDISSTNNIGKKDSGISDNSDSFETEDSSKKADFLFVVDNSASMYDDQAALSDAADNFISVIENSGLDYNIATITTDSFDDFAQYPEDEYDLASFKEDCFRDTDKDGYVIGDKDLTEFKNDLVAGDNGSATETGIWNAEHVLYSTVSGDSYDGYLTQEGMPRTDATLSIVLLSDEKSQYEYAYLNDDYTEFDPANNLFITRGYYFHSIINTSINNTSQYDDLSNNSGGVIADINNMEAFDVIMDNIATQAGGASSQFKLSYTAIPSTISVTKGGSAVANDSTNGWTYVQGNNSITFHGDALPEAGTTIKISYKYFKTDTRSGSSNVITAVDALVK